MSAFDELAQVPPLRLFEGYLARALHGEQLTLAVVEVEPGAELPVHRHANEQFGIVIEGSLRFRVGDEERLVEAGGTWTIPANVPHSAVGGPAGAIVVDVFAPPRSDWQSAERLPLQPPQWPRR